MDSSQTILPKDEMLPNKWLRACLLKRSITTNKRKTIRTLTGEVHSELCLQWLKLTLFNYKTIAILSKVLSLWPRQWEMKDPRLLITLRKIGTKLLWSVRTLSTNRMDVSKQLTYPEMLYLKLKLVAKFRDPKQKMARGNHHTDLLRVWSQHHLPSQVQG